MTEHERRQMEPAGREARAAAGIAPATWLWILASGLAFWLALVQGVLWLV